MGTEHAPNKNPSRPLFQAATIQQGEQTNEQSIAVQCDTRQARNDWGSLSVYSGFKKERETNGVCLWTR